jgi:hypothetical protein
VEELVIKMRVRPPPGLFKGLVVYGDASEFRQNIERA